MEKFIEFIDHCPTCFHVVAELKKMLDAQGFKQLQECGRWDIKPHGKYYVTRNHSSIIAFGLPEKIEGFHIMASHSDSPSFKIKEKPEITLGEKYTKLNVEGYGGMIMSTWMDRPLSVAGRLVLEKDGAIVTKLVRVDRDFLIIPSLAIHMNRSANEGYRFNIQKDLLPLYGGSHTAGTFMKQIAEAAEVSVDEIIGHDLFLYPRIQGTVWGAQNEFVSAPRLDDLQCVYASVQGLLSAQTFGHASMIAVMDNEEVGSSTKQGANSDFIRQTILRICQEMGMNEIERGQAQASSFMISADNAQAAHPNYMEKFDIVNRPFINEGIVIKYNANQKYTSDGISSAVFKMLCRKADVAYQTYVNRSDMAGGSTLGNIANSQVSMNTVDIGLAQLAMHSSYETAGVKDTYDLIQLAKTFFESKVECSEDGIYIVK